MMALRFDALVAVLNGSASLFLTLTQGLCYGIATKREWAFE